MIDNLEQIKQLLNFENEGDFYMLYVFKRKKDQPEGERDNHQSVRTIKTYCVESIEYLEKRYDEIKQLCEVFKARAYIHVQKQHRQQHLFDSIVGQIKTNEKRWIVDVDTKDNKEILNIKLKIDSCQPFGKDKIIAEIPTKNGYHLITEKFDVMEFAKHFPEIEIQKKNPTLLFLPESLS